MTCPWIQPRLYAEILHKLRRGVDVGLHSERKLENGFRLRGKSDLLGDLKVDEVAPCESSFCEGSTLSKLVPLLKQEVIFFLVSASLGVLSCLGFDVRGRCSIRRRL